MVVDCGHLLQNSNLLSGGVPLPVAYEVTVQNDNVDVRLSEESSDSSPTSPAFHGAGPPTDTLDLMMTTVMITRISIR